MLLLKNEMNKISYWKLVSIWVAALIVILGITTIIIAGLEADGKIADIVRQNVPNFEDKESPWSNRLIAISLFSVLFTKVTFLLFEAYLVSTILVDEFKKKTINQLFSYPIVKTRVLWSKVILVVAFSFLGQITAHLAIHSVIKLIAILTSANYLLSMGFLAKLFLVTIGTVLIGLLPFVFGMIKQSTVVTMISALVLAGLISNATPGSLSNSFVNTLPFLALTSIVTLSIVAVSVSRIAKKDISSY